MPKRSAPVPVPAPESMPEVVVVDSSSSDEESDGDFDTVGVDFATSPMEPPTAGAPGTQSSTDVVMGPVAMFLARTVFAQPLHSSLHGHWTRH